MHTIIRRVAHALRPASAVRFAALTLAATALPTLARAQTSDPIQVMANNIEDSLLANIATVLPYVVTIFTLLTVISLAFRMFRRYARG